MINIEFDDVVVILTNSTDCVLFRKNMKQPTYPFDESFVSFEVEVAKNNASQWLYENFKIEDFEVINTRTSYAKR